MTPQRTRRTVLVVEDAIAVRNMLEDFLGLYGYDGPHPDAESDEAQATWRAAADAGEVALGAAAFAVLDEPERDELVELLAALFAPFAA